MKIDISRSSENAKWTVKIDDEVITTQSSLTKLLLKAYKYAKSQGL